MLVLLPDGIAINNPDMIKMVKILVNAIGKKEQFLVSIKMDDDSEVTVRHCDSEQEAVSLANECTDLINAGPTEFDDVEDDAPAAAPAAAPKAAAEKKSAAPAPASASGGDDWDDWDDDDDDW